MRPSVPATSRKLLRPGPALLAAILLLAPPAPASAFFLENAGQDPPQVKFRSLGGPLAVVLAEGGLTVRETSGAAAGAAITLRFPEKGLLARAGGADPLDARIQLYRGRREWRPACYRALRLEISHGGAGGAAGSATLEVRCEEGELSYRWVEGAAPGPLVADGPLPAGLAARYAPAEGAGSFGAARAPRDGGGPAAAPGEAALRWSTFLGGAGSESGQGGVVMDAAHRLFVTGATSSFDFPVVPGAPDTAFGGVRDAFVACVDSTGASLVWCTFLGGSAWDEGTSLVLGASPTLLVAGFTESPDFPFTPGCFDSTFGGVRDAWTVRLARETGSLGWSTLLGGSGWDEARALGQSADRACLAGITWSADFPATAGAFDTSYGGGGDMFAAKLLAGGNGLLWSSFLGGDDFDQANALVVEGGNLILGGETHSANFPRRGATFDTTYAALGDGAMAKLNATGDNLLWSCFLGGADWDAVNGLLLAPGGDLIAGGFTWSPDFPAAAPGYDPSYNGGGDGFATRLTANAATVLGGTFLGGSVNDACQDFGLQPDGRLLVAGETRSSNFPVTPGGYDPGFNGQYDAYVARLSADLSGLEWGSFFGGTGSEAPLGLAMDEAGRAALFGWTRSGLFPVTAGAFDTTFAGDSEAYLLLLDVPSVTSVAAGPPETAGALALRVAPNPARGSARVGFTLPAPQALRVEILDAAGRRVRTLFAGAGEPGRGSLSWDGRDDAGRTAAPGVYFVRVESPSGTAAAKLLLAR